MATSVEVPTGREGRVSRPSLPSEREGSGKIAGTLALYTAAVLSLTAAMIHLAKTPEHIAEWWGYGAFFLICALAQGSGAVVLLRWPVQPLLLTGIAGNLAIAVLYVISRTWGMPIGPDLAPFSPSVAHLEHPDLLGMSATAAELGVVVLLTALLKDPCRARTTNALLLAGAALWTLRFAGVLP
jgi:manganese oxidase